MSQRGHFQPGLPFRQPGIFLVLLILTGLFWFGAGGRAAGGPVVIIKADDFRGPNQAWTNFLEVSRQAGIKVSIGVIAESIAGNQSAADWMKSEAARGDVEFWDHGWDHKQWKVEAKTVSEFGGSGPDHQREHLAKAQTALKLALGHDVTVFGTPYNAFDADTAAVINETPALRLFFTHSVPLARKLVAERVMIVDVLSESDGTGKPNAAKFKAMWAKRIATNDPVSLQFHPPYFDAAHLAEYAKIVAFLQAQNAAIELPSTLVSK